MAKVQAVDEQCPVELGLNILSGKWKLKILWHLSKGTILRTVFPEVPPRVEYSLSEIGCTLKPILGELCEWGKTYQEYQRQQ